MVTVGEKAPDFRAPLVSDGEAQMFELFDAIESHSAVVLLFEPADFVPVSTARLRAIQDAGWTEHESLAVVSLTGDSLFSHAAYAEQYNLDIPLVSDFHGSIADSYGVCVDEWEGHMHIPGRAAFVIDADWTVQTVKKSKLTPEQHDSSSLTALADAVRELGIPVEEPKLTES